jgi:acetyl esterase/lipase
MKWPLIPLLFFACLTEIIGASSPTDPEISPVLASSHAKLPPTFFQICGLDPLRDDAFLYNRLLREAGCKTYVKVYGNFNIELSSLKLLMGLMSLQLPWSPACLPNEILDTQIDRTIPVRRQNRTALVAQWGTQAVNIF